MAIRFLGSPSDDLLGLAECTQDPPVPLFEARVSCGFPSPADDYIERALDLNKHLIHAPAATFFARASGSSMTGIGIYDQDLLIVDRSLKPQHGDVVIVAIQGELTCKVLDWHQRRLLSANEVFPPIELKDEEEVFIEGVVSASIRYHRHAVCAG